MSQVTPQEQADMLTRAAGVRARPDLAVLGVTGDDARSWLSGQLTNAIHDMQPGEGVYALATNIKGRIMADVWVLDRGDSMAAAIPESALETVLASFEQYLLMEDAEFEQESLAVLSVQGPKAAEVAEAAEDAEIFVCDELGYDGRFVLVAPSAREQVLTALIQRAKQLGGGHVDEDGFELARLRANVPRFGRDFDAKAYPQEAGLKQRAVSFTKGCYLGQEVVCMLENRGRLSRRLMALQHEAGPAPAAGAELFSEEGRAVGRITSAVPDPEAPGGVRLLGYVKRPCFEPGVALEAGESRVRVAEAVEDALRAAS